MMSPSPVKVPFGAPQASQGTPTAATPGTRSSQYREQANAMASPALFGMGVKQGELADLDDFSALDFDMGQM